MSIAFRGGYEAPATTVIRICNMGNMLAGGSVTFDGVNTQPSITNPTDNTSSTWEIDESGGTQNQGIGSDPTENY